MLNSGGQGPFFFQCIRTVPVRIGRVVQPLDAHESLGKPLSCAGFHPFLRRHPGTAWEVVEKVLAHRWSQAFAIFLKCSPPDKCS